MTHRPVATVGRPTAGGAPLGPGGGVGPGRAGPGAVQPWVYVLAPDRLLDRLGADTPLAQLDLDLAGYRPGTPPPPVGSGRARPRPGHPHARAARLPRRRQPGAGEDSVVAAVRDRRPRRRGPRPQHRRSGPWLSGAPWSSARAAVSYSSHHRVFSRSGWSASRKASSSAAGMARARAGAARSDRGRRRSRPPAGEVGV